MTGNARTASLLMRAACPKAACPAGVLAAHASPGRIGAAPQRLLSSLARRCALVIVLNARLTLTSLEVNRRRVSYSLTPLKLRGTGDETLKEHELDGFAMPRTVWSRRRGSGTSP
jgi:hypothetical protein